MKLFLKGHRCYTPKCPIEKRAFPPGEHGQGRKKQSEYGLHLREKQKARRIYGVLERQFRVTFARAAKGRGVTGETLLQLLERRLDNVVFRLGFASSRPEGRQLVRHGHFAVNGRRVNIPSFVVREGDIIAVREASRASTLFKDRLEEAGSRAVPEWLSAEYDQWRGSVVRLPRRDEIDVALQENLIVEHYSR